MASDTTAETTTVPPPAPSRARWSPCGASGRNGAQDVQAQIGSSTAFFGPSGNGTSNQVAARVGIRHKF